MLHGYKIKFYLNDINSILLTLLICLVALSPLSTGRLMTKVIDDLSYAAFKYYKIHQNCCILLSIYVRNR